MAHLVPRQVGVVAVTTILLSPAKDMIDDIGDQSDASAKTKFPSLN